MLPTVVSMHICEVHSLLGRMREAIDSQNDTVASHIDSHQAHTDSHRMAKRDLRNIKDAKTKPQTGKCHIFVRELDIEMARKQRSDAEERHQK